MLIVKPIPLDIKKKYKIALLHRGVLIRTDIIEYMTWRGNNPKKDLGKV